MKNLNETLRRLENYLHFIINALFVIVIVLRAAFAVNTLELESLLHSKSIKTGGAQPFLVEVYKLGQAHRPSASAITDLNIEFNRTISSHQT